MNISAAIQQLQLIFKEEGLNNFLQELASTNLFSNSTAFRVSILGGHLVGRNIAVNLLTGRELLPVDSIPLEDTRFNIRYGEDEKAVFLFANGGTYEISGVKIPWEKVLAYGQNLKEVTIHLVDEWMQENNIVLLSKESLDREPITPNNLARIVPPTDVAFLVITATTPLSIMEKQILDMLADQAIVSHIAVVVTRIDLISEKDRKIVTEHIKARLKTIHADIPLIIDQTAPSNIPALNNLVENWADHLDRASLKEGCIRRRLIIIIDRAETELLAKKMELEKKDEEKRKDLLKIRYQIEQKRLHWEEIEICVRKRSNKCRNMISDYLNKSKEMAISRLNYDLVHSNNPRRWWERDLPYKMKTETESAISGIEKSIDSNITSDIDWMQNQVKAYFSMNIQMAGLDARIYPDTYNPRPPAENIRDISRSRSIMQIVMGGVTVSLYYFKFITFGWGALVAAASSVFTQEFMNKKIENQIAELSKLLEAGICKHFDKILMEASGKTSLLYEDILEEIKKEESSWVKEREAALNSGEENQNSAAKPVTVLINHLEEIKAQL